LSAEPDARMNSEYGLNDRQFTSAVCASTYNESHFEIIATANFVYQGSML
jgi:hypothetical protein